MHSPVLFVAEIISASSCKFYNSCEFKLKAKLALLFSYYVSEIYGSDTGRQGIA